MQKVIHKSGPTIEIKRFGKIYSTKLFPCHFLPYNNQQTQKRKENSAGEKSRECVRDRDRERKIEVC